MPDEETRERTEYGKGVPKPWQTLVQAIITTWIAVIVTLAYSVSFGDDANWWLLLPILFWSIAVSEWDDFGKELDKRHWQGKVH